MQENYAPWGINTSSLNIPIDLLHLATLAPSSHNSQPWSFSIANNRIRVALNPQRRLRESDPNDRQAIISLGCATEHMVIGAEYYGYMTIVTNYGDYAADYASIEFFKKNEPMSDPKHLIHFIPKRVTNRSAYEDRTPDSHATDAILALTGASLRVDILTDQKNIDHLGDISVNAGITAMQSVGFRKELSKYLKPNMTRSRIGMPGFGFNFSTPASFLAPLMVRIANVAKLSEKDDRLLFKRTPAVIVISTATDAPSDWFEAGRIYARAALIATRAGMSTAPWGAPIQIGDYYQQVQQVLGVSLRPQILCRLGYPIASTPHSPRLAVIDVSAPHL